VSVVKPGSPFTADELALLARLVGAANRPGPAQVRAAAGGAGWGSQAVNRSCREGAEGRWQQQCASCRVRYVCGVGCRASCRVRYVCGVGCRASCRVRYVCGVGCRASCRVRYVCGVGCRASCRVRYVCGVGCRASIPALQCRGLHGFWPTLPPCCVPCCCTAWCSVCVWYKVSW
jgi:hypothetical protein